MFHPGWLVPSLCVIRRTCALLRRKLACSHGALVGSVIMKKGARSRVGGGGRHDSWLKSLLLVLISVYLQWKDL